MGCLSPIFGHFPPDLKGFHYPCTLQATPHLARSSSTSAAVARPCCWKSLGRRSGRWRREMLGRGCQHVLCFFSLRCKHPKSLKYLGLDVFEAKLTWIIIGIQYITLTYLIWLVSTFLGNIILTNEPIFPECVARVSVSLWGSGG